MVAWSRSVGWLACGWVLFGAPLQRAAAQSPDRSSASHVSSILSLLPPDVLAVPAAGFNQPAAYDPPPGTVLPHGGTSIMRDGAFVPVTSDLPLIAGDRLRTAAGGSAMIVMIEHTVMFLSEESELEMRGPQRLRMLRGHAVAMVEDWPRVLSVAAPANGVLLTIDVPGGEITGMAAGDYEIDIEPRRRPPRRRCCIVHGGRARDRER